MPCDKIRHRGLLEHKKLRSDVILGARDRSDGPSRFDDLKSNQLIQQSSGWLVAKIPIRLSRLLDWLRPHLRLAVDAHDLSRHSIYCARPAFLQPLAIGPFLGQRYPKIYPKRECELYWLVEINRGCRPLGSLESVSPLTWYQ